LLGAIRGGRLLLLRRAGGQEEECCEHPKHGLFISSGGRRVFGPKD